MGEKSDFNQTHPDNQDFFHSHLLDKRFDSEESTLLVHGSSQVSYPVFRYSLTFLQDGGFKAYGVSLTFYMGKFAVQLLNFLYIKGDSRHGTHANHIVSYLYILAAAVLGDRLYVACKNRAAICVGIVKFSSFRHKFHDFFRHFLLVMTANGTDLAHTVSFYGYIINGNFHFPCLQFLGIVQLPCGGGKASLWLYHSVFTEIFHAFSSSFLLKFYTTGRSLSRRIFHFWVRLCNFAPISVRFLVTFTKRLSNFQQSCTFPRFGMHIAYFYICN